MDKLEFVQEYCLRYAGQAMDEIACVDKALRTWEVLEARFAKIAKERAAEEA